LAVTLAAGSGNAEKPLLETNLTAAVTTGTSLRRGAGFGAGAATSFTRSVSRNFDFFLDAKGGVFELQGQIIAQIFAAPSAAASVSTTAEKLTEDIAEYVFKTARKIETA
jgi:hypothetical protein